ncbi:MFS family permease [Actinopolyspora biskrensis]|uniref:MFS family permease n=1 Tax=Actinopolyspora biskrensis TaxID=1470178 RepID=A0A852Z1N9_9ACTN|nr:MFS family permease [Actinopolyspora biskrensis]
MPLTVAFAALDLTGSAVGLGGVLLANRLPVVVATLAGGVLGDVFDRRWVMVVADVWRMASQAVCGTLLLAGQLPLWALIVLQGCAGVGTALFTPASAGLVPALVPENLLRQANALLGLAANVNKVAAISVAGLLVAGLGSGWALLVDAATFAASALSLLLIGSVTALAGKWERRGVLAEVWGGWRHVVVTPWLRTLLGYTALLQALVLGPHMLLGPLLARQLYHGAASWAVIGAIQALGSIAGSALALRLRPSRPLVAAVAASLLMLPYLALSVQNQVYIAAAKLVTKIGDGQLAWVAADRAVTAAMRAEAPTLGAGAAYQVACAFLKLDQLDRAEHVAMTTAEQLDDDGPLGVSYQGALFLIGSVIAGRRSDHAEATDRLRRAQYLADALGEDGNYGWTAFGPTNVAIHRVSAAAELGDAKHAITLAEGIDTQGLPEGLSSRRAQVHIDTAWAYSQHREDAAVVVNLMEAERVAPQALHYNVIVRELLREMLKRERRSATPGLRPLAQRAGVLS